ncbi:MAG TPA: hypothetical protein VI078_18030, partial [bacterium]
QRLSASKIPAEAIGTGLIPGDRCSTPFGIEDPGGRFSEGATAGIWSAQRLSASKIPADDGAVLGNGG